MRRLVAFGLALLSQVNAAATPSYTVNDIKRLSESTQWHRLMHYEQGRKQTLSLADDGRFFLAQRGHIRPAEELQATLEAFANTTDLNKDTHAQCRFPARFSWLNSQLKLSDQGLQVAPCKRLNSQLNALGHVELKFVFSDAYMGNPASMFGHTLMRIDPIDAEGKAKTKPLLNHAIDFAGFTGGVTGGLGYALAGLTGGYPGYYQVVPFYEKVKKYTFDDSRDLWEYTLKLNQQQARMLLLHLWELDRIKFDYFFLDENCSYQLLALIEVAMPDVQLTRQFSMTAIPPDVVRSLQDAGLIKKITFRPSRDTTLAHQSKQVSAETQSIIRQLAFGTKDVNTLKGSVTHRAQVLELAYALLDRERRVGNITKVVADGRGDKLLVARSQLDITEVFPPVPTPENNPAGSHSATRFGIGFGSFNGDINTQLKFRFALHDLLDPYLATVRGGQIRLLDTEYHRSHDNQGSYLYSLTLLDLSSFAPKNGLIEPDVFRVQSGWHRLSLSDSAPDLQPLTWYAQYGKGISRSYGDFLGYAMADAVIDADGKLEKGYMLSASIEAGLLHNTPKLNTHLTLTWQHDIAGQAYEGLEAEISQQWHITNDVGLCWFGRWQTHETHDEHSIGLSLLLYQ